MTVETQVSIGQVKRDISDLVNRVAYGRERVVLTSRGKPKAVLIGIEEYQRLQQGPRGTGEWDAWLQESQALARDIMARRGGRPLDIDKWLQADRADLEARDEQNLGH